MLIVALVLMTGAAVLLSHLRSGQKLALPGVRTVPLEGSSRVQVWLPEKVLDYESEWIEPDEITLSTLPGDTSFGQRRYKSSDSEILVNVVLMGRDRTSLHKPQFCLTGQGWAIDQIASAEDQIAMDRPVSYQLPVVKLIANRSYAGGIARGVYVYWYVADDGLSASVSGAARMWSMVRRLFRTGELQRWAYVTCFAVCPPGQEEAVYQRIRAFIAAAAPEFQLYPAGPAVVSLKTAK